MKNATQKLMSWDIQQHKNIVSMFHLTCKGVFLNKSFSKNNNLVMPLEIHILQYHFKPVGF